MKDIKQIIREELQNLSEQLNKISLQTAVDRQMFGPVYHGTTEENRQEIEKDGFKVFIGADRGENIRHGYPGERAYAQGAPPPIHHLGYGIYFTTVKTIAKRFNVDSERGLKTYYLDIPRLATINFASQNTMMEWWIKNGYDPELAKQGQQGRIDATLKLTENLKKNYDAVWFKGKTIYKVLDGDQIVVFDPSRIYQIDNTLSDDFEIGSSVRRIEDKYEWKYTYDTSTGQQTRELSTVPRIPKGTKGRIINRKPVEPMLHQWHNVMGRTDPHWAEGSKYVFDIKWKVGGTENNVLDKDVLPVNTQKNIQEEAENFYPLETNVSLVTETGETMPIEKGETGDCYKNVQDYLLDNDIPNAFIIHGVVTSRNGTLNHAWIETDNEVYDPTTGIKTSKELYYSKLNPKVEAKYGFEEAINKRFATGNYGPWDAPQSLTEVGEANIKPYRIYDELNNLFYGYGQFHFITEENIKHTIKFKSSQLIEYNEWVVNIDVSKGDLPANKISTYSGATNIYKIFATYVDIINSFIDVEDPDILAFLDFGEQKYNIFMQYLKRNPPRDYEVADDDKYNFLLVRKDFEERTDSMLENRYHASYGKHRGELTFDKIVRRIKNNPSLTSKSDLFTTISRRAYDELKRFSSPQEIMDNVYWHGSGGGVSGGLQAGFNFTKKGVEGGSGYGDILHSISLSKNKNTASGFSGLAYYGSVYPVLLRKGANVEEMPHIQDANEIEDILVDLWLKQVDAVKIGNWGDGYSEDELVVLNPRAILKFQGESFKVYGKQRFANPDIKAYEAIYNTIQNNPAPSSKDVLKVQYPNENPVVEVKKRKKQLTMALPIGKIFTAGGVIKEGKGYMSTYMRGHPIYLKEPPSDWRYEDNDEKVMGNPERPCAKCGKLPTPEGHDACIANLPDVKYACCGHGRGDGYIAFNNGTVIRQNEDPKRFEQTINDLKAERDNTKSHIMTREEFKRIVQEEIGQYQRKVYTIQDLANFVTQNISTDQEIKDIYAPIHLKVLQDAFRSGGDEGVVEEFKEMWGSDIFVIGKGRYSFEKLY